MYAIKTVSGDIPEEKLGITLIHEHICCFSEYLYGMVGKRYLDKDRLIDAAVRCLKTMKETCGLQTFIDCTPVNLGRDVELLKAVADGAEINILCATGFYHQEEPLVGSLHVEAIADYLAEDARRVNAGIIKCAVETAEISAFDEKMLRAAAMAHRMLGLPIVLHTNPVCQNGRRSLEILLAEGVRPQAVTVGHLSAAEDVEYIREMAQLGCFVGLDRLNGDRSEGYIARIAEKINTLRAAGLGDRILLSHDALVFNGFDQVPQINETPRFAYCFDYILPALPSAFAQSVMRNNPLKMLKCQ